MCIRDSGDNIACNIGRALSLNDEAVSFFAAHNILTQKLQVIDGKEFRDFLRFFGGDGIKRTTSESYDKLLILFDQIYKAPIVLN